uniref:Letm1 RBD domain-containing protein n=1 Tax=Physcomitrium patens TaxID=3218 RepID=A0A7I4AQ44_PHYPA
MHSALCSGVCAGVTGRLVESPGSCCNVRKSTHAVDSHSFCRSRSSALKNLKQGPGLIVVSRIAGSEKFRVFFPLREGGAGLLYPRAFSSTSEESASQNGIVRGEDGETEAWGGFDEAKPSDGGDQGQNFVHALHEAASVFQSAMEEQESLTRGPWFAQKWLGIDKNAWMRALAYQAAVHSLLQAVQEIAARGEGRDRDIHILVQRSSMRQCAPLRDSIQQELSTRDSSSDDWLWLQQHPQAVASFVSLLEKDKRFAAVTSTGWEGTAASPSNASDVALLKLFLTCSAAITKLGATAVSCPLFTSLLPEEIGRQIQKLLEFMSIEDIYKFSCSIGFKRQFLDNFGSRAADVQKWQANEREGVFWINLIQQLLCAALVREGVHLKLQVTEGIEDLQQDLGLFGFFVALGRSTRAYLASRGVGDSEESLASLLRYLDGGSVLFYPQFARVSSYQLFVEVVCEEMEWLSFYPGSPPAKSHNEHKKVMSGVSKAEKQMALGVAIQMCSSWVGSFGRYSTWVLQPQGFRGATFLEKGQQRLEECFKVYKLVGSDGTPIRDGSDGKRSVTDSQKQDLEGKANVKRFEDNLLRTWDVPTVTPLNMSKIPADQMGLQEMERQLKLFDENGKGNADGRSDYEENDRRSTSLQSQNRENPILQGAANLGRGLVNFIFPFSNLKQEREDVSSSAVSDDAWTPNYEATKLEAERADLILKEDEAIEQLRGDLAALEDRIRQAAVQAGSERASSSGDMVRMSNTSITSLNSGFTEDGIDVSEVAGTSGGVIGKSIEKLKDATSDAWRGTVLLGSDVGVAVLLLRRSVAGQELTDREQKILMRTVTDLASVIPIAVLMLLPVTAVGHAAILAAIKKYVPGLIPTAYGRERLDVLRRLEQLKELESENESDNREKATARQLNTISGRKLD